jgi:myo-inositol-1-phosphate synthase
MGESSSQDGGATAGRTGVWLIGARGSVATTAVVGAAAIRAGLAPATGLVSELPEFHGCGLPAVGDLVFGGHDIVECALDKRAETLAEHGVLPPGLPALVGPALAAADAEIRPGVPAPAPPDQPSQAGQADRVRADLSGFRARHRLDQVVVVNLSATEPPPRPLPAHQDLAALQVALAAPGAVLPPSSLYAYAALTAGCGFVDFTPSAGARLPALDQLARQRGLPYAGSDGKTGETLVKSVLAPMFATRALAVTSWSGTNLLGGGDGANLADPAAAASKTASKQRTLAGTLGAPVDGEVHIDYVPDLGDWKTAWDHIRFRGFLGVAMTMQFVWQGCDSALAAPLVLDLARFTARALQAGRAGPLADLGFYFKDPVATTEHRLGAQFDQLCRWAAGLAERP